MDFDYLNELDARVALGGVTGESSAESILAAGKPGLEFFAAFGPAYAAQTQAGHDYDKDIERRYEEQREITFARLRADAEQYTRIQDQIADTVVNIRNIGSSVFEAWRGEAAGSANTQFNDFLKRSEGIQSQFEQLAEIISVAVDAVDRICFEKAKAVHELRAEKIGGRTPDDIAFLVDFGRRCASGNVTDDELTRVADLCDVEIVPALCRTNPQVFERVAADVNGWLANVFVPFYEARHAKFDAACKAAADTTNLAWEGLRAALSTVHANHFARPDTRPAPIAQSLVTQPPQAEPSPSAAAGMAAAASGLTGAGDLTDTSGTDTKEEETNDRTGEAELMSPSAFGAGPLPAAAPVTSAAATTAAQAAGTAGNTFFGGVPFFGVPPGGGDRDRQRNNLPIAGEQIVDQEGQRDIGEALVIGGESDRSLYNEDEVQEAHRATEKSESDEDFQDEEDLW